MGWPWQLGLARAPQDARVVIRVVQRRARRGRLEGDSVPIDEICGDGAEIDSVLGVRVRELKLLESDSPSSALGVLLSHGITCKDVAEGVQPVESSAQVGVARLIIHFCSRSDAQFCAGRGDQVVNRGCVVACRVVNDKEGCEGWGRPLAHFARSRHL
eukprot:7383292-Prymnesium_polylepis.2